MINNETNLVSIIIPAFNVENFIQETIENVKSLNYSHFECIIINDGSTDQTIEEIQIGIKNDNRFKVITTKNRGVSAARNYGIEMATGKYIMFLDADDLLTVDALTSLVEAANKHNADFVYGKTLRFNSENNWYIKGHINNGLYVQGKKEIEYNTELFYSIGPGAKLISSSLLSNVRFPESIGFGEDQVVTFSMLINAKKIYCIDKDVYKYRVRDSNDSLTQTTFVNGEKYLEWLVEVTRINIKIMFESIKFSSYQKNKIMAAYLDRLLQYEVYPIFKKSLKSQEKQSRTIRLISNWFKLIPLDVQVRMITLEEFLLYDLNNYLPFIAKKNFNYLNELTIGLSKLIYEKEEYPSSFENEIKKRNQFINSSYPLRLVKRGLGIAKLLIRRYHLKNKLAAVTYYTARLLPVSKDLVIFAKSKKVSKNDNVFILYSNYVQQGKTAKLISDFSNTTVIENMLYHYYLARAVIIVVDDYFYPLYSKKLKKNQNYIQVWHAVGAFKKFGADTIQKVDSKGVEFEKRAHQQYTHLISSSPYVSKIFAQSFLAEQTKIFSLGSAKTDIYFDMDYRDKIKKRLIMDYPQLENQKIILYVPTFKGNDRKRKAFNDSIDWLNIKLPNNFTLIYRLHPIISNINSTINEVGLKINDSFTTSDLILSSDVIISDYSSLFFESIIAKKTFIFYLKDIEQYEAERGLTYIPREENGDLIAKNDDELSRLISEVDFKKTQHSNNHIYQKYLSSCDGNSNEKIICLIDKLIKRVY